jgi:hypothetical protein
MNYLNYIRPKYFRSCKHNFISPLTCIKKLPRFQDPCYIEDQYKFHFYFFLLDWNCTGYNCTELVSESRKAQSKLMFGSGSVTYQVIYCFSELRKPCCIFLQWESKKPSNFMLRVQKQCYFTMLRSALHIQQLWNWNLCHILGSLYYEQTRMSQLHLPSLNWWNFCILYHNFPSDKHC